MCRGHDKRTGNAYYIDLGGHKRTVPFSLVLGVEETVVLRDDAITRSGEENINPQ